MEVDGTPSPESIDRELARTESAKRRTRWIFGGSAVFAIVGIVVLQFARTHQQKRVLNTAWQAAAGCLLGGALKEDERASVRFRRIKLAVGDEGAHKRHWPERCSDALATLQLTLVKQDKESEPAKHAHKLLKELQQGHALDNLSFVVDQLVDSARAVGLSTDDLKRPEDKPPPKPVVAWDIDSIGADARLTEAALGPHAVSSDRWQGADLNLLFNDPKVDAPPMLCTFNGAGAQASCRTIAGPAAQARELRLHGTADRRAAPLLFGTDHSETVVFDSRTGAEIARGDIQSAWVADGGHVSLATGPLDDEIGTFELLEKAPGGELTRRTIGPDDFAATTVTNWAVAFGQFVVQSVRTSEDQEDDEDVELPRFRARSLPVGDGALALKDVGELDWVNAPLSFCASQRFLALKVGTRAGYLTFFQDGQWSAPTGHERLGNLVQCDDKAMLLHDFGPIRACDQASCKDAGLTDASFGEWEHVRARRTVLGDKLLAVAESEQRMGIRTVHGAGEVQLLFDDLVRRGEVQVNSTVSGTRIFSRATFAVALLFTEEGVVAIYFGPDGKPQPVAVSRPSK